MSTEIFQRETRIAAPLPLVWAEVGSLAAVLKHTPAALAHEIAPDGRSASVTGTLAWGPIHHSLVAHAEVVELAPSDRLGLRLLAPELSSRYEVQVRVHQVGSGETALEYRGELELGSWTAQRLRGLIVELLEEHVHALTGHAKVRAERHHRAEESLGG